MRKRVPLRTVRMYVDEVHDLVLIDYEWITGNYVRKIEYELMPKFIKEFIDAHKSKRMFNEGQKRWEMVWSV